MSKVVYGTQMEAVIILFSQCAFVKLHPQLLLPQYTITKWACIQGNLLQMMHMCSFFFFSSHPQSQIITFKGMKLFKRRGGKSLVFSWSIKFVSFFAHDLIYLPFQFLLSHLESPSHEIPTLMLYKPLRGDYDVTLLQI